MRSPGARRMIHTRVRSFSDSSVEPTHGLGFLRSRSNSAAISAGHCDLSFFSAALSSMLRAMGIPPINAIQVFYIANLRKRKDWGRSIGRVAGEACGNHWRLDERPAQRAFAAPGRMGRGYLRAREQ